MLHAVAKFIPYKEDMRKELNEYLASGNVRIVDWIFFSSKRYWYFLCEYIFETDFDFEFRIAYIVAIRMYDETIKKNKHFDVVDNEYIVILNDFVWFFLSVYDLIQKKINIAY